MCLREAWRIAFCIVNHLLDSRTCKDLDQGKKSTSLRIRLKKKTVLYLLDYVIVFQRFQQEHFFLKFFVLLKKVKEEKTTATTHKMQYLLRLKYAGKLFWPWAEQQNGNLSGPIDTFVLCMIISLSDLINTCKIKKNCYFQTRPKRFIYKNVPENLCFSSTNLKPERRRPFGTRLVRHCPQGLFSPFITFLRAIFFHPFRLSLVPTISPWVSEDGRNYELSGLY